MVVKKPKRKSRGSKKASKISKTALIGRFDGELKTIAFKANDKVSDLLKRSGLSLSEGEEINDEEGKEVKITDTAKSQKYFLTGNFKNGSEEAEEVEEELSDSEGAED